MMMSCVDYFPNREGSTDQSQQVITFRISTCPLAKFTVFFSFLFFLLM